MLIMRHTLCKHMSNVFLHLKPVHTHTDPAKYNGRNAQELPKSSEQVVEIFDTTGDNCEGKKQSTFLSLNKCSVDSPPLDANWNRKSKRTAGLGKNPAERLPTKGGRTGRGFKSHINRKHVFPHP